MLKKLMQEKINKEGISVREAGRQIGVAHTTVGRILQGETPNYATLVAISEWLGTPTDLLMDFKADGPDAVATKLVTILSAKPELQDSLEEVLEAYTNGDLGGVDVIDIIDYICYRLGRPK